jgi:hypothetical protein
MFSLRGLLRSVLDTTSIQAEFLTTGMYCSQAATIDTCVCQLDAAYGSTATASAAAAAIWPISVQPTAMLATIT